MNNKQETRYVLSFMYKVCFLHQSFLISTGAPVVPQESLQYRINNQESCPNVSVLIQIAEIKDIAPLTHRLTVSSSDGCALQECPMLLSPGDRTLTLTLLNDVNYTATLEVSNDCGSGNTTVSIQPGKQMLRCIEVLTGTKFKFGEC